MFFLPKDSEAVLPLRLCSIFSVVGWRLLPGVRVWSPPGGGQGGEGRAPRYPYAPRTFPCSCGGGRRCRISCTLIAVRRWGVVGAAWGLFPAFFRWMAAVPRRPGVVASRRGAGDRGLRSPLPPTTPNPALGQPPLTDNTDTRGVPSASSLPRSSGRSASRCPARARDERPSGVGASAPFGAAISSAPCRAYVSKRNRCSFLTNGASSLNVKQEKRFPLLIPCTVPEKR